MSTVAAAGPFSALDSEKFKELETLCPIYGIPLKERQILVNIRAQKLHLVLLGKCLKSYAISTAKNGIGQKEGSNQTPLGLHFVSDKIGEGAKPFEVFKSRVSTREIANPNEGDNVIVGRILRLHGAQPGFNQGKDAEGNVVDSYLRYIYIHGTNDLANMGRAVSKGCIRMLPENVIELFANVAEKTPVYIYQA